MQTSKIIQGEKTEWGGNFREYVTRDGNRPRGYHLIGCVWTEHCLIQASADEPGDNQGPVDLCSTI